MEVLAARVGHRDADLAVQVPCAGVLEDAMVRYDKWQRRSARRRRRACWR
jgi:hypothetical protein